MKALIAAAICITASAQDILVYGTMPNPYQILKWDTFSGAVSPVSGAFPGFMPSPELSAIDYIHMVYYNLIYNINTSTIQLVGTNLQDGSPYTQVTIPFTSGAKIGHGESLCVDHRTGNVYLSGPTTSTPNVIGWLEVDPIAKTFRKVGTEIGVSTVNWWGSSSTYDSRRNVIWTMAQYNMSGSVDFDIVMINISANTTTKMAVPNNRWCMSLSYDVFSDRIYASTIQAIGGVLTHVIASFSPSLTFDNWRQANTTGFQPLTMVVAFHHAMSPPVLFSLALPIGQKPSPTAGPWFIAGFEADTGAFITQHYACRSLMNCPVTIEVAQPFGPRPNQIRK